MEGVFDRHQKSEVALQAVDQNGMSLRYASKELQNDKEIVLLAIAQDGKCIFSSLQYASKDLQNDKEVVLRAVAQNGKSLQWASK